MIRLSRQVTEKSWVRAALLVALCAGVAILFWSERTVDPENRVIEKTSDKPIQLKFNERQVVGDKTPAVLSVSRRDQDFWPQEAHAVFLARREVLPTREMDVEFLRDEVARVWLIQLGGPLDDAQKVRWSELGVTALSAGAGMTFYVRSTGRVLADAAENFSPKILGWVRPEAADKILFQGRGLADFPGEMRVQCHPGTEMARVEARVKSLSGKVLARGSEWLDVSAIERTSGAALALEMAALDDVYLVEPVRPAFKLHNELSASRGNATLMLSSPFNLNGAGITVMVRDEGRAFAHPDFDARLQFASDVAALQPVRHATHVAGTIGGSGLTIPNVGARGFAPGAGMVSYELSGDETSEVLEAKNFFGAQLSNHSYGFATGWNDGVFIDNQATFGIYSTFSRNWDALVRTENVIIIKSAGNDRADSGAGHPHDGFLGADGNYYNTVDQSGTGKNILSIGAAVDGAQAGSPSSAVMVTASSSSGPTGDGRLRPELIANGESVLSCDNTPVGGNTYVSLSGASMAAASVSGSSALFMQRFKQVFGAGVFCPPHYLRAIFAQTATDFGRAGPDYLHGFGMLDLSAAVTLLDVDAGSGTRVRNSALSGLAPERWFEFTSDGTTPIRATLCWSDEAGDALAKKTLVNDLDLRLVKADSQGVFFPYTLNPLVPDELAKPGINQLDTIEQLVLNAPVAGTYLLAVRGTTLVSPMSFTLASSLPMVEQLPPIPRITTNAASGTPPFVVNFDGSGSTDPDGSIVKYQWSFGDGSSAEGASVTHVYLAGTFQATLKVIDNRGASSSTSVTIAVANKPPVVELAASPANGIVPLNVMFSTTGTVDPDGMIESYLWNFGDGTVGSGATISHVYVAPGLYWPTVSVTDNGGTTTTKTISIFAGDVFQPSTGRLALNFAKPSSDSFAIATTQLPISPDLVLDGLNGVVSVGLSTFQFTLDAKGYYRSPLVKVRLSAVRSRLSVSILKVDLVEGLGGVEPLNIDTKNQTILVPFAVTFQNGLSYGSRGLKFIYTSRKDKRGSARFLKE